MLNQMKRNVLLILDIQILLLILYIMYQDKKKKETLQHWKIKMEILYQK